MSKVIFFQLKNRLSLSVNNVILSEHHKILIGNIVVISSFLTSVVSTLIYHEKGYRTNLHQHSSTRWLLMVSVSNLINFIGTWVPRQYAGSTICNRKGVWLIRSFRFLFHNFNHMQFYGFNYQYSTYIKIHSDYHITQRLGWN